MNNHTIIISYFLIFAIFTGLYLVNKYINLLEMKAYAECNVEYDKMDKFVSSPCNHIFPQAYTYYLNN